MARLRQQRPVARRAKAVTTWSRFPSTASVPVTIAFGAEVILATVELSNPGIGETILRTRGLLQVTSDQGSAFEDQNLAFGMIVVSDPAAAVGITAVPKPGVEASDDGWFVHQYVMSAGASVNANDVSRLYFDSKAMRRVEEGFQIAVVAENMNGSHGLRVDFAFAILSKLS